MNIINRLSSVEIKWQKCDLYIEFGFPLNLEALLYHFRYQNSAAVRALVAAGVIAVNDPG